MVAPGPPPPGRGGGQVRIVGGRWRGTKLAVADVPGLRPTADRPRETLFNWLQPALPGARVLDLYAGTGVLGLEALSRGAREVVLVERDRVAAAAIAAAIRRLDAGDAARVVQADALQFLRAPLFGRFDLVFVDPPFADGAWAATFAALGEAWLAPGAWLYVESAPAADAVPGAGWRLHREGGSRDARHALYRRDSAAG